MSSMYPYKHTSSSVVQAVQLIRRTDCQLFCPNYKCYRRKHLLHIIFKIFLKLSYIYFFSDIVCVLLRVRPAGLKISYLKA